MLLRKRRYFHPAARCSEMDLSNKGAKKNVSTIYTATDNIFGYICIYIYVFTHILYIYIYIFGTCDFHTLQSCLKDMRIPRKLSVIILWLDWPKENYGNADIRNNGSWRTHPQNAWQLHACCPEWRNRTCRETVHPTGLVPSQLVGCNGFADSTRHHSLVSASNIFMDQQKWPLLQLITCGCLARAPRLFPETVGLRRNVFQLPHFLWICF